jgi:hypothetical protein
MKVIERLRALLADVNLRVALIKEELIEIRENTEMSVVQLNIQVEM